MSWATKMCRRCLQHLPRTDFRRDRQRPDGLDLYCRPCCAELYDEQKRARVAEWGVKYRAANRDEINAKKQAHYHRNRESIRRASDLARFGVDREEFVARHGAVCRTDTPGGRHNRWAIDHDRACCPGHRSCGLCVRGILCHQCNPAIGMLREDPDLLYEAAVHVLKRRDVLGDMLSRE